MPAFSLFDVLLSGATLIVELNDPVCLHWHIGNDKTNPREQFTRMPFHLGDDTTGFVPGRSLILEVAAGASHMVGRTAHRALEQMRNLALKNTIGAEPDGIEIALRFEHPVEVWDGEGGVTSEEPHQVAICISRHDRLQNVFPTIRTVHIAGPQSAAFKMTKLIEDEQRVITHAAEMTVPGRVFLRSVGRADRAIHIQRDPLGRFAFVNPVDPLP